MVLIRVQLEILCNPNQAQGCRFYGTLLSFSKAHKKGFGYGPRGRAEPGGSGAEPERPGPRQLWMGLRRVLVNPKIKQKANKRLKTDLGFGRRGCCGIIVWYPCFSKFVRVLVSGGNHWFNSDVVDGLFLPGLLVKLVCWGLPGRGDRDVRRVVFRALVLLAKKWCQTLSVSHPSSHDPARKAAQLAPCR